MDKRRKTITVIALFLTCVGILLISIATIMWMSSGDLFGLSFPKTDGTHVGFAAVGTIYLVSALGMYLVINNRKAMIEENDERNKIIQARSGLIGFGVQTLLIFSSLILLYFMGYMHVVTMFTFVVIGIISILVFTISNMYLKKVI